MYLCIFMSCISCNFLNFFFFFSLFILEYKNLKGWLSSHSAYIVSCPFCAFPKNFYEQNVHAVVFVSICICYWTNSSQKKNQLVHRLPFNFITKFNFSHAAYYPLPHLWAMVIISNQKFLSNLNHEFSMLISLWSIHCEFLLDSVVISNTFFSK